MSTETEALRAGAKEPSKADTLPPDFALHAGAEERGE